MAISNDKSAELADRMIEDIKNGFNSADSALKLNDEDAERVWQVLRQHIGTEFKDKPQQ